MYDDFGCAWQNNIMIHGRMYLTENYFCFASSILGMNKKVTHSSFNLFFQLTIKFVDITDITKTKVLAIFNSGIEISTSSGETYEFF